MLIGAGEKKYRVPRLSDLAPIILTLVLNGTVCTSAFLSRSHFTPCMSMKEGPSVMGDCQ